MTTQSNILPRESYGQKSLGAMLDRATIQQRIGHMLKQLNTAQHKNSLQSTCYVADTDLVPEVRLTENEAERTFAHSNCIFEWK